MNKKGLKTLNF